MSARPSYLISGEPARLFPVLAPSSKEDRAMSVFLGCLARVREFRETLLNSIGVRVGARASMESFTQIVFKESQVASKKRPDGLIVLRTGRRTWRALVEAKIGTAQLDMEQLDAYVDLAREQAIDTVITVSNQLVWEPAHHPVKLRKSRRNAPPVLHWSWTFILTQASMLLDNEHITDPEQRDLLREFVRFLSHESAGVARFTSMNPEWTSLLEAVQTGKALVTNSPDVQSTVLAWHQESKDLALQLSRDIGRTVSIDLTRKHAQDPRCRLAADADALAKSNKLSCRLQIPDTASPLSITADIARRTLELSMSVRAPEDRKRAKARIRWLLNQFRDIDPSGILVRCHWPGRARHTQRSLTELREAPELLCEGRDKGMVPYGFDVFLVVREARRFSGRKKFIEMLEAAAPSFYLRIGQNLQEWRPRAPKIRPPSDETTDAEGVGDAGRHVATKAPEAIEAQSVTDDSESAATDIRSAA